MLELAVSDTPAKCRTNLSANGSVAEAQKMPKLLASFGGRKGNIYIPYIFRPPPHPLSTQSKLRQTSREIKNEEKNFVPERNRTHTQKSQRHLSPMTYQLNHQDLFSPFERSHVHFGAAAANPEVGSKCKRVVKWHSSRNCSSRIGSGRLRSKR